MVDYLYEAPSNVTTATQMVSWINDTTALWLFQSILIVVFVVSLVAMLKNRTNTASKSVASASFITMILAIFARTIDLIPTSFMSIWIVMVGFSSIWMYVEGTQ